ncbi:hypothetical protein BpHYR1_044773 [Brachionus plicatilis]|uniref:Uncharacterized protein n=1 Tax=Brachionus plicatilis TaxID=10195 RepID=A0A3M7R7I1_BRAPC|nr:hypothetical protein BpHYR1_044773 [Brachionus plicatilis]
MGTDFAFDWSQRAKNKILYLERKKCLDYLSIIVIFYFIWENTLTIAKEIQEYKLSKDINTQRFITPFDHLA